MELAASCIGCINFSSKEVEITSCRRSTTWRLTSALKYSQRAAWSTFTDWLRSIVSVWFTGMVAWCWGSSSSNVAFQTSVVVTSPADILCRVEESRGLRMRRLKGPPSWETTSKVLVRVTGVFLEIIEVEIALSKICLDDGEAIIFRGTSAKESITQGIE